MKDNCVEIILFFEDVVVVARWWLALLRLGLIKYRPEAQARRVFLGAGAPSLRFGAVGIEDPAKSSGVSVAWVKFCGKKL